MRLTPVDDPIATPGIRAMSAARYHADPAPAPSLSSSLARTLLDQSPLHAWTEHPRLNPSFVDASSTNMDFGAAAHRIVLGAGADLQVIDAPDWRTKAAQTARDEAREAGRIPMLVEAHERAIALADAFGRGLRLQAPAIRQDWEHGASEQAILWREGPSWCRALVDRLHVDEAAKVATVFDLKTTSASAAPADAAKRIFADGYDVQMAFYRRGLLAVRPDLRDVRVFLLWIESAAPHGLTVMTLGAEALALAERKVRAALHLWRACMSSGIWPGYPATVATAHAPPWHEAAWLERETHDPVLAGIDWSGRAAA